MQNNEYQNQLVRTFLIKKLHSLCHGLNEAGVRLCHLRRLKLHDPSKVFRNLNSFSITIIIVIIVVITIL